MDRHTDSRMNGHIHDQHETIIPCHHHVVRHKKGHNSHKICFFFFFKSLVSSASFKALAQIVVNITKTRLFKHIENFTSKNGKFSDKNSDIFHISAQIIDCGYLLEWPQ